MNKDAWIHTRDSRNIAKVLPPSAETILQNCELCITIHDIEMFHYGKELAHESIHVSWIDSFSLNLWLNMPKWIDSRFLRDRIDSALAATWPQPVLASLVCLSSLLHKTDFARVKWSGAIRFAIQTQSDAHPAIKPPQHSRHRHNTYVRQAWIT